MRFFSHAFLLTVAVLFLAEALRPVLCAGNSNRPYPSFASIPDEMITRTRQQQALLHRQPASSSSSSSATNEYITLRPPPSYSSIPPARFEAQALELAHTLSALVGYRQQYRPSSGLSRIFSSSSGRKQKWGEPQAWFYSIDHHNDALGKEAGLEEGRALSVLWRHWRGETQMMNVDQIKDHEGLWRQLQPLEQVLGHHG